MKLSARFENERISKQQELAAKQLANANNFNLPLLDGLKNKFGFVPDKLLEVVKDLRKRVVRIVPKPYEEFDDMFKGVAILRDAFAYKLVDGADKKTGLPILYVYVPEYDKVIREKARQENKAKELARIKARFQNEDMPDEKKEELFANVQEFFNGADFELPKMIFFDGSRERCKGREYQNPVKYGDENGKVFAVVHYHESRNYTGRAITFFIDGLDYQQKFANRLADFGIPEGLTGQISASLEHLIDYKPDKLVEYDGHKELFSRLTKMSDVTVCTDGDNMAAIYKEKEKGKEVEKVLVLREGYNITFDRLKKRGIGSDVASQIVSQLPTDILFSVRKHFKAKEYAELMPKLLGASEGDIVTDLLQGDLEVIRNPEKQSVMVVDMDDEYMSCFPVVRSDTPTSFLNIYLPNKG